VCKDALPSNQKCTILWKALMRQFWIEPQLSYRGSMHIINQSCKQSYLPPSTYLGNYLCEGILRGVHIGFLLLLWVQVLVPSTQQCTMLWKPLLTQLWIEPVCPVLTFQWWIEPQLSYQGYTLLTNPVNTASSLLTYLDRATTYGSGCVL
jgi:hypothetical protein